MIDIDFSQIVTAETKTQADRKRAHANLADLRWRHETGGLYLPEGIKVHTTREAQAQIASMAYSLNAGLISGRVDWKFADGWQELSTDLFLKMAQAVVNHVKDCFAAEREVARQMNALRGDLSEFDYETAFKQALTR